MSGDRRDRYVEACASAPRLVQGTSSPRALATVLRRFHAMGHTVDVTPTVSLGLVALADPRRLEACAAVLGWLSGRPMRHADPVGRLPRIEAPTAPRCDVQERASENAHGRAIEPVLQAPVEDATSSR